MTDLEALLARVEKAEGTDRGLDGMIARDVLGWLPYFGLDSDRILDWPSMGGHWHRPDDPCNGTHNISYRHVDPPEFTASIDAALALVERVLPEKWQSLRFERTGNTWGCFLDGTDANASTRELSLLAALFRALSNHKTAGERE